MNTRLLMPATLLVTMFFAACAAKPQLLPRSGGNPAGVDLSGNWQMRGAEEVPLAGEQTIVIPRRVTRSSNSMPVVERRDRRSKHTSVHVFMESGRNLKITQTAYGIFISFDRAVVEEYNFGENRLVEVGPIEAQRVSGWEGEVLVIETMDEGGNVLVEKWRLDEGGDVLLRDMAIVKGEEQQLSLQQVFDRA